MLGPNQQKWVDALRSGEYNQTTGTLQDDYGYCCLGVACKVALDNGVNVNTDEDNGNISGDELSDQKDVKSWLGLYDNQGRFETTPKQLYLTTLNDIEGLDFNEIADYIEKYSDILFTKPK